jgi:hypothetical protein
LADIAEQTVEHEEPGGLADALIAVRFAGYCVYCDRMVERMPDGSCPEGHPAEAVSGRITLDGSEGVPQLPRFNLAAFLIPPIWGPAHGQWVGAIFLPMWLFMDSIISSADRGGVGTTVAAVVVVGCTLAFGAFFAKRGNGLAYRRVCARMSVDEYVRRERIWAIASVPVAAALVGWALWFHLVFEAAAR